MIGLAGEDAPADFAVGGGEEDLRRLEMEPEVLLCCDVKPLSKFGLLVFSWWILNSNHSERGCSNQSSQKSQAKQPTGNVGAGWLLDAAFPDGK